MNPIRFTNKQLDIAWEFFYYKCAEERYDYISLIENISYSEIWILFSPPKNRYWNIKLLKIHGAI